MKHRLTNNLGLKLLSVLVACMIWLIVRDNSDPESTQSYRNVPVTIVNQDTITNANKTYTVVDDTDRVTVFVTARRSVRTRLSTASFTVRADLENYNEDIGSVPLEVSCADSAVTQDNMRIQPASLKINMEDKIEQSFGIVASVSGKAARGYELGRTVVLTGDTIRIAGPQSLINIIGKVTVPVDISTRSESSVEELPIRIEDKNGTQLTESQMNQLELKNIDGVILQNNLAEVEIEIWAIYNEIPLKVELSGEPADGYEVTGVTVTPQTVNLTAPREAMEAIGDSLQIEDAFLIEGIEENKEFTVDLNETLAKYPDVRLEADLSSTVTVSVTVDELGSTTVNVPVSELQLLHAPRGKRLIFSPTDVLAVKVRSLKEKEEILTAEDIQGRIDLSECSENGSYTLPVEITLPQGYTLSGEVTIVVNVEEEEREAEVERLTED